MKESKDHINIDLEFLDRKEPIMVPPKSSSHSKQNSNTPTGEGYNWKKIIIIGGFILFFVSALSSPSTSTPTTETNLLAEGGRTFICSDSNYYRALQLKPSSSTGAKLAKELETLSARIEANKSEKAALEATYVDQTDQYAIDNYNYKVDSYNAEYESAISDANNWKQRQEAFDAQIDSYNNYLDTNCKPQ